MKDLAGRLAVVTGGGSGMGRELVRQLVAEGCSVAFCDVSTNGMTETKRLCVSASDEGSRVVIRFADTGIGISSPENLFRPFQRGADSSGLGLYVSRAIIHSFGGELLYERRSQGCCFAVVLPALSTGKEVING